MRASPVMLIASIAGLVLSADTLEAQQRGRGATQLRQPWQCTPRDTARAFQRELRVDSLRTSRARTAPPEGTRPVTGGTQRSQGYPEFDVVLDIPNLCVNRIFLEVDTLTAKLSLDARVSNLVRVNAGAEVFVGTVDLTIEGVRAQALLLVDLDDVVYIVDQTLTFIDNNPQIVQQLGSTLQNVGGSVGGLVGNVVGGLVLTTRQLANGQTLQRIIDRASGEIIEQTLGAAGEVVGKRVVGSLLRLNPLNEARNAAGSLVRRVRDESGRLVEYTLDAANKISDVKILP